MNLFPVIQTSSTSGPLQFFCFP